MSKGVRKTVRNHSHADILMPIYSSFFLGNILKVLKYAINYAFLECLTHCYVNVGILRQFSTLMPISVVRGNDVYISKFVRDTVDTLLRRA